MPETSEMEAAVHTYVQAFAEGDADMAASLFADDATVEDPVGSPPKVGIAQIRKFYAEAMATGAKLELDGPIRCAANNAAFPFHVTLEWDGKVQRIDVIDIFRFDEAGKVIEMRAFFGSANMSAA